MKTTKSYDITEVVLEEGLRLDIRRVSTEGVRQLGDEHHSRYVPLKKFYTKKSFCERRAEAKGELLKYAAKWTTEDLDIREKKAKVQAALDNCMEVV